MKIIKLSSILLTVLSTITFGFSTHISAKEYVGSAKCANCNQKQYNLFGFQDIPIN